VTSPAAAPPAKTKPAKEGAGGFQRVLDMIERIGNKVPHPAILFLSLCVAVIILSQILYLADARITTEVVKPPPSVVQEEYVGGSVLPAYQMPAEPAPAASYHVVHETVRVEGLLTVAGIRYLFTSFVSNFLGFTAMGIILVIMIGVGVAEISGLIASLTRKMEISWARGSGPWPSAPVRACGGGVGQAAWAGPDPSGAGSGMRHRVTSKPRDPSLPTWWATWRRTSRWRS